MFETKVGGKYIQISQRGEIDEGQILGVIRIRETEKDELGI